MLFLGVVQCKDVNKLVINLSDEGVYLEKKIEDEHNFTMILPSNDERFFNI